MTVTFFRDRSQLLELQALQLDDQNDYIRRFFIAYLTSPSEQMIENVHVNVQLIQVNQTLIPITICEKNWQDAYVVSLYAHYISYAMEELVIIPLRWVRVLLALIIRTIGLMFRLLRTDRTVFVNNWLFSTNLYADLTEQQIIAVVDELKQQFPRHFIVFRSLQDAFYRSQMQALTRYGAKPFISRQVYISKHAEQRTASDRSHMNSDRSLLRKKGYRVVRDFVVTADIVRRVKFLYDSLYISKYSKYNPQFTSYFYESMLKNKGLTFILLYDGDEMIGVIAYWYLNGVMTVPILGYEVERGKETGAYRVLSYLIAEESRLQQVELNQSSGAAQFKLNRGTVAKIEYSYIYSRHLNRFRRWTMEAVATAVTRLGTWLVGKVRV